MKKLIFDRRFNDICLYYDIMSTSRSCDGKIWIDYYRVRPETDEERLKILENVINKNHDFYSIRLALEEIGYTVLIKFYFKEIRDNMNIKDYRCSYYYYIVINDDYNKDLYGDPFLMKGKFIYYPPDIKKYKLY